MLFEYAKSEMEAGESMERVLILAGTKRLRPIVLAVPASIAGLLPLALVYRVAARRTARSDGEGTTVSGSHAPAGVPA